MNNTLTLGSLFDGSGGFPLGGIISGIIPIWSSEIEPFAIRVTEKRLPYVKHYGDVSTLKGDELPPVDIITFGSPCQNLSIAGNRMGLEGDKSSLFYQAVRIIKEMRDATDGKYPRYAVWENVKGAFSSNKGEDFRAVLEELVKVKDSELSIPRCDKWKNAGCILGESFSIAWRVLDAQYWGVPQRRERIYLVADFTGASAGDILFESEGLSGYSSESFRSWQRAAGSLTEGFGETGCLCLNDQGGNRMDVTEDKTSTLRAEAHHPPIVAGFSTEHSAKSRSIGYEEEVSPTLRAGNVPATLLFENHSQDSRYKGPLEVSQTVSATFGMGGNNQPFVVQPPRAFGVCSKESNSMKSDNPKSGFYEAETSRCLDANGGNPSCNQGGMAVVQGCFDVRLTSEGTVNARNNIYKTDTSRTLSTDGNPPEGNQGGVAVVAIEGNGSRPSHKGDGYKESDAMYTLNTVEQHGVAYGLDRASYNQGENAKFNFSVKEEVEPPILAKGPNAVGQPIHSSKASYFMNQSDGDVAETLVATDYKDPPTVCEDPYYIVRRLTPIECARLQGFPDWWCQGLESEEPTDEEIDRWIEIFETNRKALGKTTKPKTRNQVIKWLKNPYTDSAAYKMWGNGVALPNVYFVLSGIVYYAQEDRP